MVADNLNVTYIFLVGEVCFGDGPFNLDTNVKILKL